MIQPAPVAVEGNEAHQTILEVDRLAVTFYTPQGTVRAVRDASFHIRRGEVLGLVGESGCGKSTVAFAMMGYLPGTARVDGEVRFEGRDVAHMSAADLRDLRGRRIAIVYQDPAAALNPSMRVGRQVEEALLAHLDMTRGQARQRTADLFESVGLPGPKRIGRRYPHQLSGGMQQRVVIAMALACDPHLLIMDEPTTGLDVTTEANILDLVVDLKDRVNAGILFVTHNLGVIARVADRVAVMYAGQTIEQAPVRQLFSAPRHPYTAGLLSCVPRPVAEEGARRLITSIPGSVYPAQEPAANACLFASRCPMAKENCHSEAPPMVETDRQGLSRCFYWPEVSHDLWEMGQVRPDRSVSGDVSPVLSVRGLRRFFGRPRRKYGLFGPMVRSQVRAVVDVGFDIPPGATLGVVGESGSGKSTIARVLAGLIGSTRGEIELHGQQVARRVENRTPAQQAAVQMVFQNPSASLNPRLPISHAIIRSLRKLGKLGHAEARQRAGELLEAVGLDPAYLDRPPTELSGGQQQRVALATAFAANPQLIIADEAVSSLDVSVQAQVLNLLAQHQEEYGTAYMFIGHDLGVVRYVSDWIMVMYAGHVAEYGPAEQVLSLPSHPYTEALISSAPIPDPGAEQTPIRLEGVVPTQRRPFRGCFFAGRCPRKIGPICDETPPPARTGPGSDRHIIHCHIPVEELREAQKLGGEDLRRAAAVQGPG